VTQRLKETLLALIRWPRERLFEVLQSQSFALEIHKCALYRTRTTSPALADVLRLTRPRVEHAAAPVRMHLAHDSTTPADRA
jgi:hypothetical protein